MPPSVLRLDLYQKPVETGDAYDYDEKEIRGCLHQGELVVNQIVAAVGCWRSVCFGFILPLLLLLLLLLLLMLGLMVSASPHLYCSSSNRTYTTGIVTLGWGS